MWEDEMGVKRGEMTLRGLALSIPPLFASLLVGQMAAQICHDRFGVPVFSATQAENNLQAAAMLHRWEVGAGEADYTQGQAREPAVPQARALPTPSSDSDADTEEDEAPARRSRQRRHGSKYQRHARTPSPTLEWLSRLHYDSRTAVQPTCWLAPHACPNCSAWCPARALRAHQATAR